MWDFERANAGKDYDISYTIPSACARALAADEADIGIIPAAAYTTTPNLLIIPDVAIAARRAVRSILLVSKMPLEQVRTVALDTSSLTSVALAKILFAKWLGGPRTYSAMEPQLDQMLAASDAALLIGDPALGVDRTRYVTLDLAEEWNARTAKPFVFAFWAIRKQAAAGENTEQISETFRKSRDHGLAPENLETIAQEWAPRLGLTIEAVRTYLVRNIHYYLDPPCLEGLRLFFRYGAEIGALPAAPELHFISNY
jgi:chorismate dehydratase